MKFNKWTMGLAAVGVVSLASAARADEQKSPMSQVATAVNGTTISGNVDFAATWRPGTDQGGRSDSYYYGYGANIPKYSYAKNDGFSLNAVDIVVQKAQDESLWASGYYVDLTYGADAAGVPLTSNNYYSYGSARSAVSPYGYYSSPVYGFAVRQAYIALRTPVGNSGIDWKVGVWDTIIGYESSTDALNPNYTRSYGYTIEPTTHTGILATYKVNDMVTLSAGVANSIFMPSFTPTATYESQKAYMGSIALTAPDSMGFMKGATLTMGIVNGTDSSYWANGSGTSLYAGATIPTPLTALKVGAAFDYYDHHDSYNYGPYDRNSGDDSAWVAGLYANYLINDKASFNLRGEYMSNQGEGPYSYAYPNYRAGNTAEEVTATLQYNLWANVLSRVEFRWDHIEHGNSFGYSQNNYYSSDYYTATKENDFMLALNLIYQF